MPVRLPLSVFIIAKDEADRIPKALQSVRDWVDEVLVIDSGSQDDTVSVSIALGARTLFREWQGYGAQKVFGEAQCRNDWVLNIDADEQISAELRRDIIALFAHGAPGAAAYRLPILPLLNFQAHAHRWTVHHEPVRLYKKSCAGFKDSPVHDSVIVHTGETQRLRGVIEHRSFRDLNHHLAKVNSYSNAQAEDRRLRGKRPGALELITIFPLAFLKSYVLRRQFLNGLDGIVISYMFAFQRFIRLAKTRELYQRHER